MNNNYHNITYSQYNKFNIDYIPNKMVTNAIAEYEREVKNNE